MIGEKSQILELDYSRIIWRNAYLHYLYEAKIYNLIGLYSCEEIVDLLKSDSPVLVKYVKPKNEGKENI